jgi:general secretion pathway protein D
MKNPAFVCLLLALVLLGCGGQEALRQGQTLIESGNEEAGLARLEEALRANPGDTELRNYYQRQRAVAVQRYLQAGDNARASGAIDAADVAYQRAQRFDPDNTNAQNGLDAVARARASVSSVKEAEAALNQGAAPGSRIAAPARGRPGAQSAMRCAH